ncbi:MAG: hypothetical protein HYY04_08005 [Chloroflexi bacterium]|nr:hypothetical protein [Chloroflexota bacterium]
MPEDLLDYHVQRSADRRIEIACSLDLEPVEQRLRGGLTLGAGRAKPLVEPLLDERLPGAPLHLAQVGDRIPETIRVVDPKASDLPLADQPQHQPVGLGKHCRPLHSDRRQLVHVKKAPVVDLLGRDSPER